jgi:hypothetical protein
MADREMKSGWREGWIGCNYELSLDIAHTIDKVTFDFTPLNFPLDFD